MRRREHGPRELQPELWLTHEMRVFLSFWVFGCLATMQFVVVVTAANDLVGNQAPPGLILFAYTLPSVLIRAFVPYIRFPTIRVSTVVDFAQDLWSGRRRPYTRLEKPDEGDDGPYLSHHIGEDSRRMPIDPHEQSNVAEKEVNYALRLSISALSSFTGLQLLSFSKSLPLRVLGISLTSLSSNLGDMSFYQLATRFPISMTQSLGGYAAGSGAAGLIGSAVYTILTSWAGVETPYVLSGMGLVPVILLVVYGLLLPEVEIGPTGEEEEELNSIETNLEAGHGSAGNQIPHLRIQDLAVRDKLKLVQPMVLGYMLPLATLMLLENTTIQGILPNSIFYLPLGIGRDGTKPAAPSLLSPLFKSPRDFYPTYITIYQLAVFAGRTSINFVRLPSSAGAVIYWVLCLVELFCFMIQYGEGISMTYSALDDRDVWFGPAGVMFIIALMGLCGGVGMSNTYWRASKEKLPRRVWRVLADIRAKHTLGTRLKHTSNPDHNPRPMASVDEHRVWEEEDEMDGLLNAQGQHDHEYRSSRQKQKSALAKQSTSQELQRGRPPAAAAAASRKKKKNPAPPLSSLTRSTSTYPSSNRPSLTAAAGGGSSSRTGSYLLRSRTNINNNKLSIPEGAAGGGGGGGGKSRSNSKHASAASSSRNSPGGGGVYTTTSGGGAPPPVTDFPFPDYLQSQSQRRSHSVGSTSYGTIETPPRRSTSSVAGGGGGGGSGNDDDDEEEEEEERDKEEEAALREFLISTIALPDTLAIMLASVVSLWMQPRGCRLQVEGGRGLCVKAG